MEEAKRRSLLAQVLWAVHNDDVDALQKLWSEVKDGPALVNAADYDQRTPLHVAASSNSVMAAQLLLRAGAKVDARDRWSHTPLANAQQRGFKGMVKLLRRYGAQPAPDQGWESEHNCLVAPPHSWDWLIVDPGEVNFDEAKLIGKGSFGEIRQARWRGTVVAVKTIRPSLSKDRAIVKDFLNEVELLVKLRHPNIVQFLAAVITQPPLMLVTEYLPGGDLHALIQKGPVPCDLAITFALDMARGMAYLHGGPDVIIHRDLKPRNLLIDESNELKVVDFGLSKLVRTKTLHEDYKLTGETGSYRYMAPEVFLHQNYDTKVDVFSFGMILYEMFEGAVPFASEDAYMAASLVAKENLRPEFGAKAHYPEGMRELITRCWTEFAVKRPDFESIIEELQVIQARTARQDRHCFRHLLELIHRQIE